MKLRRFILPVIFALFFIVLLRSFFISNYIIDGQSMEPTLSDGDRVFVNQFIDLAIPPEIDDIYFFKLNKNELMVKRIVARPHDYIKVDNNTLFVNGKQTRYHDASVKSLLGNTKNDYRTVPDDCYLVMGDNIQMSTDSRTYGCIHRDQMLGKVIYTYWHKN